MSNINDKIESIQMRDYEVNNVKIVQICEGDTTTPTLALDEFGNIYSFKVRKFQSNDVSTLRMLVKKFK